MDGAGWRKVLIRDMRLLQAVLHNKLKDMPDPNVSIAAWESFWRKYPGAWCGLVRNMVQQAAA